MHVQPVIGALQMRCMMMIMTMMMMTGWPKRVSQYKIMKQIVLKPANDIRFLRQIKALNKHCNIVRW